jgi:hypothetical protein
MESRDFLPPCVFVQKDDTASALYAKINRKYSFLASIDEESKKEPEKESVVVQDSRFKTVDASYITSKAHEFFSMCICGPSLSGKTTLLLDILSRFVEHKRYAEYVIVSPTAKATKFFDKYLTDKEGIISEYDDAVIQDLLDRQAACPKAMRKSVCLVIDDCIGSSQGMQRSKTFADLWALARNMHMTVIMLSQAVNRQFLPKIARCNCHILACCGLRGKSCIETLRSDYLDGYGDGKEGIQLYKDITCGPYNFCLFNLRDPHAVALTDWVMRIRARPKVPVFKMENTTIGGQEDDKKKQKKKHVHAKDMSLDDVSVYQCKNGFWSR